MLGLFGNKPRKSRTRLLVQISLLLTLILLCKSNPPPPPPRSKALESGSHYILTI